MTSSPTISVIIPVYNGERFLAEAIQSVLEQSLSPEEVIVVDDGSTDGSAALAAQFAGVIVVQQPNRGVSAALNLGVRLAHGDLLAFLDADDRWLPTKLEKQMAALAAEPDLDMVFGHVRQFREGVSSTGQAETIQPGLNFGSMLIWCGGFERVGPFPGTPQLHVFVDWYARAQEAGLRSRILPDLLYERRIHATNLGRRTPEAQRLSYLRSLRQSIERRRGRGPAEI